MALKSELPLDLGWLNGQLATLDAPALGHAVRLMAHQWQTGIVPDARGRERLSPGVSEHWQDLEPLFPLNANGARMNPVIRAARDQRAKKYRQQVRNAAHARQAALLRQDDSRLYGVEPEIVEDLFEFWCEQTGTRRAKLTDNRRELIARALSTEPECVSGSGEWRGVKKGFGYNEADIRDCILGYCSSPFHQGDNDRRTRFLSLELMLRSQKHVNRGIEMSEDREGVVSSRAQRVIDELDNRE